MGVAILVSEILLLSKTAKFPFLTMDYSPWSEYHAGIKVVPYLSVTYTSNNKYT